MKMTKKLGLLASVLVGAVAMIFTSCDPDLLRSFGKDDFYGTWNTIDFDASGNAQQYYVADNAKYFVQWIFDGSSEDLFSGNGTFKQILYKYPENAAVTEKGAVDTSKATPDKITFWYGAYKITGNSDYTKGKLYLYYEIGLDLKKAFAADKNLTLETIVGAYDDKGRLRKDEEGNYVSKGWKLEDYLNYAFDNELGKDNLKDEGLLVADAYSGNADAGYSEATYGVKNSKGVDNFIQIRYASATSTKVVCSDIEYFRFNLKDPATSGYSRMMATVRDKNGTTIIGATYDQWIEKSGDNTKLFGKRTKYGYKVREGCSWNKVNERYFGRISVADKDENGVKDDFLCSDTSTNAKLFSLADADDDTTYTIGADELEE